MTYPPPYIVEPAVGYSHTHTIILLHGRSSTAQEFANDVFALHTSSGGNLRSSFPTYRWLFLDAGQRWCTPFKENRSAWFDTFSLKDLSARQDLQVAGLRDGIRLVKKTVENEVERSNGRAERVALGGFSQGSAVALWSLFTGAAMTKGKLGAFIGLSAWMPFTEEAKEALGLINPSQYKDNVIMKITSLITMLSEILGIEPLASMKAIQDGLEHTPVFLGHGVDDVPVDVKNCDDLAAIFSALEASVEVGKYTGAEREGHWIKEPEQVNDLVTFLGKYIGEK